MINLRAVLSSSVFGVICLTGYSYIPWEWLKQITLALGVLLVCVSTAVFAVNVADNAVTWKERLMNANPVTEQMRIANGMSDRKLDFVERNLMHFGRDVNTEGAVFLHGTSAPLEFVEEFLERSSSRRACPVRAFSEGTLERVYAQEVTEVLIAAGYAEPAAGNMSARWKQGITPEFVARKLGRRPLPHPTNAPEGWQEVPE